MPRTKIEVPPDMAFSTELQVRITDVNYGQHLGNDTLLSLLHEARLQFLARHGFSETDVGGPGLIMADAACIYQSQGRHGDRLRIEIAVTELRKTGFDMVYRVTRSGTGEPVALARTGMVCFDYERGKPVRMPEAFARVCAP